MPEGFAKDSVETLRLMGLGFDASFLFTAWDGSPCGMPNFGIKIPRGLMLTKERKSRLKYLEINARKNFQRYTFKTSFGDFLPFKAYGRWKVNYDKYKSQFEYERDRFLAEYDLLPDEVRRESDAWISEVFHKVSGADRSSKPALPFSENLVSMMLSRIPAKREISKLYRYKARLLPYLGLGLSPYSGKWPSSNEWTDVAKEGLKLSIGYQEDIFDEFTKVVLAQFAEKCRSMTLNLLERVSNQRVSHKTLDLMGEALLDIESLNFFEDKEVTQITLEAKPFLNREHQPELEGKVSDLLAYVNSNFTNL